MCSAGLKRGSSNFNTTLSDSSSSYWLLKGNDSSPTATTDAFPLTFSPVDDLFPQAEQTDMPPIKTAGAEKQELLSETYSNTPSTRHAKSCLLQLLSQRKEEASDPGLVIDSAHI